MAMGHEAFLCRTMIGPAVVGAAVPVPVEAEAQVEEATVTANVAVGTRPRQVPLVRPTVVVPECQRMGMVKAEANNTIHRKVCSTKSCFLKLIFPRYYLSSLKLFPFEKKKSTTFLYLLRPLCLTRIFRFLSLKIITFIYYIIFSRS